MALTLRDPPNQGGLTLFDSAQESPIPFIEQDADSRATRYAMALAPSGMSKADVRTHVDAGNEEYLRTAATGQEENRRRLEAEREIRRLALGGIGNPLDVANQLRNPTPVNRQTALDESYAQNYMERVLATNQNNPIVQTAVAESPEAVRKEVHGTQRLILGNSIIDKIAEETRANTGRVNWYNRIPTSIPQAVTGLVEPGTYGGHLGVSFFPGTSGYMNSPDMNPGNILLPGSSRAAERSQFWNLMIQDPAQAENWLRKRVAEIARYNPIIAQQFIEDIKEQTTGGTFLDDAMGLTAIGSPALLSLRGLFRNAARAATGRVLPEEIEAAAGNIERAAQLRTARQIVEGRSTHGTATDITDRAHTLYNPNIIFTGDNAGTLVRENAQRLQARLGQYGSMVADAMGRGSRAPRITQEALEVAYTQAAADARVQYRNKIDHLLDMRPGYDVNTHTRYVEMIFGEADGTLPRTANRADRIAQYELGLTNHKSYVVAEDPSLIGFQRIPPLGTPTPVKNNASTGLRMAPGTILEGKITGVKGITGTVRLRLGDIEVPVSNRGGVLYKKGTDEAIDVNNIAAYKSNAKGSEWITVKTPRQAAFTGRSETVQQGGAYYIRITKPYDETNPAVRAANIATPENINPNTHIANVFFRGLFVGAEEQLSLFQRGGRHVVTHLPAEMERVVKDMWTDIGRLNKESNTILTEVLEATKFHEQRLPNGELVIGRAFRRNSDFEKAFLDAPSNTKGRLPTDQETLAYFGYHIIMDLDWTMRSFGVARDLIRQGQELFTIRFPRLNGDFEDAPFVGRFRTELPQTNENVGIWIHDGDAGQHIYMKDLKDSKNAALLEKLEAGIARGDLNVIEVGDPINRPLRKSTATGNTINFVITKEFTTEPIPFNLVDYRPGVHILYPHQIYLKQVINEVGEKGILRNYGEKTGFGFNAEAEAIAPRDHLKAIQRLLREDKVAEAEAYVASRGLPEEYLSIFRPVGGKPPHFDLTGDIDILPAGKGFYDVYPERRPEGIILERNSEFNAFRAIDMDYLAERNTPLKTVTNHGTNEQPLWKVGDAETINPWYALNRTLGNGLRNLYLNDYKIAAIEQWAAQYGPYLRNMSKEEALKNPFQAFYYGEVSPGIDRRIYTSAITTKDRITNFLGVKTEFGRDMNWAQQKLMNLINKLENTTVGGQRLLGEGATRWYAVNELFALKHPLAFTRSIMFDTFFGFFNPMQYFIQAQGYTQVAALAGPEVAAKAMAAYTATVAGWFTKDPATFNRLANIAAKMGWNKKDFIEMYTAMRNQGIDLIGKEHTLRNHFFDPGVLKTRTGSILEFGRKPFNAGERVPRITGWAAAWLEYRKANPNKIFDEYDIARIATRADDMSGHMTRASNAGLQESGWAVPAQFYTYSHRLAEQYYGGAISKKQMAAVFGVHAALYGIPVAASSVLLYPFYEELRKHLLLSGSPLAHNQFAKLFTDGFLNFAINMITGVDTNAAQRYGPGFSNKLSALFNDIAGDGDPATSFISFFGGAAGSFVTQAFKATYPFRASFHQAMHGQQAGEHPFTITKEHFFELARLVRSVEATHNAYYAASAGKYFQRGGDLVVEGLNYRDAAALYFGLFNRKIQDTNLIVGGLKDQRAAQNRIMLLAETEMRRAYQAMGNPAGVDMAGWTRHSNNAYYMMKALGDLQPSQINAVIRRVEEGDRALADRVRIRFTQEGYNKQLHPRWQMIYGQ